MIAAPAGAVPVDVFFEGPTIPSDPNTNFGLGEAQALSVSMSAGVPIIDNALVRPVAGRLDANPSFSVSFSPNPPTSSLNRASESWTADNISGGDLTGATYLLFTHTDPFMKEGVLVDYADSNVGLTIDEALGWVIIKSTSLAGDDFYYPAIQLDRSVMNPLNGFLAEGATSDPWSVEYVVKEALVPAPVGSLIFQLPELEVGFANVPVPEPSTAALLALGFGALGVRRTRRS